MANETELEQTNKDSNQPATDAGEQTQTDSQKLYDVNGQKWTADELLKNYKELQGAFTKKTQTKDGANGESTAGNGEGAEEAKAFLLSLGFVTKDDIEAKEAQLSQDKKLEDFVTNNPNLAPFKEALRAIGKTDNSAYEDLAVKYKFIAKDKLAAAKSGDDLMGEVATRTQKEKSVAEMTPKEYEDWRAKNLKRT